MSFSMKKTKRKFKPNVLKKKVYSEILDEMIPFHITTSALRTIDKFGGLDNYLLRSRHVTEGEGLRAKQRLVDRIAYCEKNGIDVLPPIALKVGIGGLDGADAIADVDVDVDVDSIGGEAKIMKE